MEQRISIITLGVADVSRARTFYERLGWHGQEMEETVFFQAGSMAVILWGRAKLAEDSGVADTAAGGFDGVVLAHNLRSRAEVDALLASVTGVRHLRGVVRGMITEHDTTEHNSQVFQLDRDDYTYIG